MRNASAACGVLFSLFLASSIAAQPAPDPPDPTSTSASPGRVIPSDGFGGDEEILARLAEIDRALREPLPTRMEAAADMNGDVVGEWFEVAPGRLLAHDGTVVVRDGVSGEVLLKLDASLSQTAFGYWVSVMGDINGDHLPDVGVASLRSNAGGASGELMMDIFSGEEGTRLARIVDQANVLESSPTSYAWWDANVDGTLDLADVTEVVNAQGQSPGPADVNDDGAIDAADVAAMAAALEDPGKRQTVKAVSMALSANAVGPLPMGPAGTDGAGGGAGGGGGVTPGWWQCSVVYPGELLLRIVGILLTIGACEVNPPACVVALLCQACGIVTTMLQWVYSCFTTPPPQVLHAIEAVEWVCDACSAVAGAFVGWEALKKGLQRLRDIVCSLE